jgi:chromosome segregation ATPase
MNNPIARLVNDAKKQYNESDDVTSSIVRSLVKMHEQELAELKNDLAEKTGALDDANKDIAEHKSMLKEMERTIEALRLSNDGATSTNKNVTNKLSSYETKIAQLESDRFDAHSKLSDATAEISRLSALLSAEQNKSSSFESLLSKQQTNIPAKVVSKPPPPMKGFSIQPRRDTAGNVLEYLLTPIKE